MALSAYRYILRRAQEDFHINAGQQDATIVQSLWSKALNDLEVVRRQSLVYKLYSRKLKNVMVSLPPDAEVCTSRHDCLAPGCAHEAALTP